MARRSLRFRLVNVFTEEAAFSGNALAVIEDAHDLSDQDMQAIALQFNLSETTFVLPSAVATARVRIFTPSFELPTSADGTLRPRPRSRSISPFVRVNAPGGDAVCDYASTPGDASSCPDA